MFPELVEIFGVPIRWFGVLMAASFLGGIWYISRISARDNKPFDQYLTLSYIFIFGGIIGARLGYVVLHLDEFSGNWSAMFNPFAGDSFGIAGLNLYGGILLSVGLAWAYQRWKGMNTLDTFDYFAPALALGIGISRIGCYCNGCCFGTPTDLPWGVQFPDHSIPWFIYGDQHLHPSQLYSSIYGFALFGVMHFVLKKRQFVGQVAALTFMSEAVFRFLIEEVRFYEEAMVFELAGQVITWNQVVSVLLFLLGLGMYLVLRRRPLRTAMA